MGCLLRERHAPKDSFAGHQMTELLCGSWKLDRAYFNGEALWTYRPRPFSSRWTASGSRKWSRGRRGALFRRLRRESPHGRRPRTGCTKSESTLVGPSVGELIHAATVAIVGAIPISRLWHAVPSYPTISENPGCGCWKHSAYEHAPDSRLGDQPLCTRGNHRGHQHQRTRTGRADPNSRLERGRTQNCCCAAHCLVEGKTEVRMIAGYFQ